MTSSDVAELNKEDIIREVRLQFSAGHAEIVKRMNKHNKKVQTILMDMEHFDVNTLLDAECAVINDEKILEIVSKRFTILFPDQKLDIL
ncbi:MAG: hypothetical protein PF518_04875 [Spirochaetaceae bacterium]|nr:hypothetical protein [Spirochaetaceae bacterium]